MSVFNKTYENLLEDRYIELDNLDVAYHYMKILNQLNNESVEYTVSYRWNWINDCGCWLIQINE